MRLKRIKIVGFKSFADNVVLEFHEGITGVVGPNGCGKSNISDAFKWVFGESAPQSLRGKKSEDFIFSGTTTRKALNFAEVTLTLTDIRGSLPVEYEEIEVTRRCHRDGSSEYFINRQAVRRMDVLNLFLDSGIGKSAFSMVFEQGETDKLIRYSPQERRSLFEEAAGTQRFRKRREEAMRKLEKTEGNMSPLKEVHKEVSKQLATLEKQAEEAQSYKGKKEGLERLLKGLVTAKWKGLQEKGSALGEKSGEHEAEINSLNGSIEALNEQMRTLKQQLEEKQTQLRQRSEDVYKVRSDKEIRNRERQTAEERFKESEAKELHWQQELQRLEEKKKEFQGGAAESEKRSKQLEQDCVAADKELSLQRRVAADLEEEVSQLRRSQQQSHQQRVEKLRAAGEIEGELKQYRVRIESIKGRLESGVARERHAAAELMRGEEVAKEKQKEMAIISESVDKQKERLTALEEVQRKVNGEVDLAEGRFDLLQHEGAQASARLQVLKKLQEEMEGFSSGSKQLLQEKAFSGIITPLYEHVEAKKGDEDALSSVLRSYSQTLVVEKNSDFQQVLAYAKEKKLKDFSLLCLEAFNQSAASKPPKGFSSFLDKMTPSALAERLFGRVFTAKESGVAYALVGERPGTEVWLEEGGFLDSRGVLFYTSQGEQNLFLREAEIKALELKTAEIESEQRKVDALIDTLQEKRALVQSQRIEADKEIRRSEMKHVESNFSLQKAEADCLRWREEIVAIEIERKELDEKCGELELTAKRLASEHAAAAAAAAAADTSAEELAATLEKKEPLLVEEQKKLTQLQHTLASIRGESARLAHKIQLIELQESEREERCREIEKEKLSNRRLREEFKLKGEAFAKGLEEVEKSLTSAVTVCSDLEKEVESGKEFIAHTEKQLIKEAQALKKLEEADHKLGIQSAQVASARQSIEDEVHERFQMPISTLLEENIILDKPLEEAEKEARALRREVESAQEKVNMASIEELEQFKERDRYLSEQIEDLTGSKDELLEIINKLDEECRTLFIDTFKVVRENFRKNFNILFNGGEADLEFDSSGDVLEAGIEIIAKPPGKKMRSINLLSGGEKCLTAVALLFAIFEVKPAPFCILDEIDAPLDDTNVERFLNVVKQFVDRCQFIIITHNKRTMAICDRLFGVSMEEKGVSKLLSMEFNKQGAVKPVHAETH